MVQRASRGVSGTFSTHAQNGFVLKSFVATKALIGLVRHVFEQLFLPFFDEARRIFRRASL
jgi:hypothetical protein